MRLFFTAGELFVFFFVAIRDISSPYRIMPIRPRDTSAKAIDEVLSKVRVEAYQKGYEAGKREARDELIKTLVDRAFASTENTTFSARDILEIPFLKHTRGKPPKIAREILSYVNLEPGKTGAEIAQNNPQISERTVRTSLRRLRLKNLIKQEGGKWFPVTTP